MLSWFNGSNYELRCLENEKLYLLRLNCALSNSSTCNINEYKPALKIMFSRKHFNPYSIKFVVILESQQNKYDGK